MLPHLCILAAFTQQFLMGSLFDNLATELLYVLCTAKKHINLYSMGCDLFCAIENKSQRPNLLLYVENINRENSMSAASKILHMYKPSTWKEKGLKWTIGMFLITLLLLIFLLQFLWSREPDVFDVNTHAQEMAEQLNTKVVNGFTTTATLYKLVDTLLEKSGGFIENDKMPPGVFMDNMPNWEFGVITQARDMSLTLRNDFSRSQSQ